MTIYNVPSEIPYVYLQKLALIQALMVRRGVSANLRPKTKTVSSTLGPQAGPQTAFHNSVADVTIYGGAAGGGKTYALLLEPLKHIDNPGFGAVIFRNTYRQITEEGGMWQESEAMYPPMGGGMLKGDLRWVFASGARARFRYLQHEQDKYIYQGAQICFIGWDQLEHFSETQFFYLLSRNRSTCGVRPYTKATCNPDPDSWLAGFLSWWIDQDTGYAIDERSGVLRFFLRVGQTIEWADSKQALADRFRDYLDEMERTYGIPAGAFIKSCTFIPAKVQDNRVLLRRNPEYLANLLALRTVDRERLLAGNWKVRDEAGKVFNKSWFDIVPIAPKMGIEMRFWDFAATAKKTKAQAATASVKMILNGRFYASDCTEDFLGPAEIDKHVLRISIADAFEAKRNGRHYAVRWEIEPGSAGKREDARLRQLLRAAFASVGLPPPDAEGMPAGREEKMLRWKPFAQSAYIGDVAVVDGPWNDLFLDHLHNQPTGRKDIADAASGVHNGLCFQEQERKDWDDSMRVQVGY